MSSGIKGTVQELQDAGILLVEDGNHGEYRPRRDEFADEGTAFIRAADMVDGRIDFRAADKINDVALERIRKGIGQPGDVVLSHKGTVGKLARAPLDAPPFVCSPQTTFWRVLDDSKIEPRFLFYHMQSRGFRHLLDARKGETDMADYVSLSNQRSLELALPELPEQRQVAHILGALDDKIELNRRMNRTLEAIARAIFKSWFVDFDPVHAKAEGREPVGMDPETAALFPDSFQDSPLGKIPKGWDVRTLSEAAEVVDCLHSRKPKLKDSGHLLLQVYNVGQYGELDLSEPYWVDEDDYAEWTRRIELAPGDCVITKTGRVGAVAQIPSGVRAALGRNMVGIRNRAGIATSRFLRCLLTSDQMCREIERMTSDGTILQSLHVKAIEKLRLTLPPVEVLKRFEGGCHPLLGLAEVNTSESSNLAETRDTLLPRLISGDLTVAATGET